MASLTRFVRSLAGWLVGVGLLAESQGRQSACVDRWGCSVICLRTLRAPARRARGSLARRMGTQAPSQPAARSATAAARGARSFRTHRPLGSSLVTTHSGVWTSRRLNGVSHKTSRVTYSLIRHWTVCQRRGNLERPTAASVSRRQMRRRKTSSSQNGKRGESFDSEKGLPTALPTMNGWSIFMKMHPARFPTSLPSLRQIHGYNLVISPVNTVFLVRKFLP